METPVQRSTVHPARCGSTVAAAGPQTHDAPFSSSKDGLAADVPGLARTTENMGGKFNGVNTDKQLPSKPAFGPLSECGTASDSLADVLRRIDSLLSIVESLPSTATVMSKSILEVIKDDVASGRIGAAVSTLPAIGCDPAVSDVILEDLNGGRVPLVAIASRLEAIAVSSKPTPPAPPPEMPKEEGIVGPTLAALTELVGQLAAQNEEAKKEHSAQMKVLLNRELNSPVGHEGGGAKETISHADVRLALAHHPQIWWVALSQRYEGMALPIQDWASIMQTVPLDSSTVRARPLLTEASIVKMLKEVKLSPHTWPLKRTAFFANLANVYGYYTGSALLEGVELSLAIDCGNLQLRRTLVEVGSSLPFLSSDVAIVSRTVANNESVSMLVSACDRAFAPPSHVAFTTWANLNPRNGETGLDYFYRVRGTGSTLGYQMEQIASRFKAGMLFISSVHAATVASDFQGKLAEARLSNADIDISDMAENPIYTIPLSIENKPALPPATRPVAAAGAVPQGGGDGLSLPTGAPRPAYDLPMLFTACKTVGIDLGAPPAFGVGKCAHCEWMGVKTVGAWGAEGVPQPKRNVEAYEHNPYRCARTEVFADKVIALHPTLKREDLIRIVENPREVAEAAAGRQ